MKKNQNADDHPWQKVRICRKCFVFLFLLLFLCVPKEIFSQDKRFTFQLKNVPFSSVCLEIQKNSDYSFVYNTDELKGLGLRDYQFKEATLQEILKNCLENSGLNYRLQDKHVVIYLNESQQKQSAGMRLITGKIKGEDGSAIPGVTVLLKGTHIGTTSGLEGDFQIYIPVSGSQTLAFSFVGLQSCEVDCTHKEKLEIVMQEEVLSMDEAIAIGYQNMRKRDIVGSVTTLKADDILMPGAMSIDQMLQGRVAGMMVMNTSSRVGTTPKIRVRGTSTILGNQEPLWVVDGIIQPAPIPITQEDIMTDDLKNILGNQISWLNPQDIKDITVLKDAAATAIYGSKAANGVIVITTKRGEVDGMTVRYSVSFDFRARPNYDMFNLMNSAERIQFSNEAFKEGALYEYVPQESEYTYEGIMRMLYDHKLGKDEAENAIQRLATMNTDWFKILTRNSFSHNHNLTVSGGSKKITYNASLGFTDQSGVELRNDSKRLTGRLNLGVKLHAKLRLDMTLAGTMSETDGYAAGVNPVQYATTTSRSVPAYNEDGSRYFLRKKTNYKLNTNEDLYLGYNILNEIDNSYSKNKVTLLNGNLNFSWNILPWLKYEFVGGLSVQNGARESFAGEQTYYVASQYRGYDYGTEEYGSDRYKAAMLPHGGELYNSEMNQTSWNIHNKLSVQKNFGEDHRLNVLLGTEVASVGNKERASKIWGFSPERGEVVFQPTPLDEIVPMSSVILPDWGILHPLYNGVGWKRTNVTSNTFSLFATLAYTYKNRYVFNGSIRNDESNRFGQDQNKRFDPTYSFGLSWSVADEPWMAKLNKVVNQLTLRASYGIQGNAVQAVSPELILKRGSIKKYFGNYTSSIYRLPNPELSWERTKSCNFGVDLQLFRWVMMDVEYYRKSSNNIITQNIALEYGMPNMLMNGGRVTNSGVEYTLNITPIRTKNWTWTLGLNSSKNWNEIKTVSADQKTVWDYLEGSTTKVLKEGYDLSSFWSFAFRRLNPSTGRPEFHYINQLDENGNILKNERGESLLADANEITDFLVYSGKSQPDFTGGITTRLRWKDLTFGANFALLIGAKKRLHDPFPASYRLPSSDVNLNRELLDRWKKPGDDAFTNIPGVYTGQDDESVYIPDRYRTAINVTKMWAMSDIRVVDASFLRCQQMSLTWNMNRKLCSQLGLKGLQLSATMNNVFVIASKKFHGFDPELGDSVQPKMYSVGLNVSF